MSEGQPAPPLRDEYYAVEIRAAIKRLSELAKAAKEAGLSIQFNLAGIGEPTWMGYHDAVIIIRKY